MKKLILLILTFAYNLCNAQSNLVPNPSFEDTIECPHYANQLDKAVGWHVSKGSPDYFNDCAFIADNCSVPYNFLGYQYAHSGSAYCGFIAAYLNGGNEREYFTCQLINPLITGVKYRVSYYLSLANSCVNLASNKMGLLFSTVNYNLSNPAPVGNYSQFYTDSIITDTLNWVHVEGSFIADSDYVYMTIGNFFDDTNTDTIYIPPASQAYYYIDDIAIMEDTTTNINDKGVNFSMIKFTNPVKERLKIVTDEFYFKDVSVISITGQPMNKMSNLNTNLVEMNIGNLKSGIYFIKLKTHNNNIYYYKFIKL